MADGRTTRTRWHSLALVFQREINRLRGSDILLNMGDRDNQLRAETRAGPVTIHLIEADA
jgi:hypothetical protein